MSKVKQARYDRLHTAKSKEDWKKRLQQSTGISAEETGMDFTWEKMDYIAGEFWKEVIHYGEEHDVEVKNIVAIMGKDTRKTTVFVILLWFLMNEYRWLNGFLLRDTIEKATTQMRQQLRKGAELITNEYGVEAFNEITKESTDGYYLVRDPKRKDNQKIELLSFNAIVELGGFTTSNGMPAMFIYDELQNPNSAKKEIISKETFLANYKFIDTKNRAIEISTETALPKWIPRHVFLSNRYIGNHPLNQFAEEHFPYYDQVDDDGNLIKGVREWMLENPMDNNFVVHYVGKDNVKNGWEDFSKTLIIYGSKLSNFILRKDKEWEEEQLALIERGRQEDLAVIIGDLFEGYDDSLNAYHYTRKDTITREEFEQKYAPYVNSVNIAIDVDFSRQIRIRPKYSVTKNKNGVKIFRVIRERAYRVACRGVSDDGFATKQYFDLTYNKIMDVAEYVRAKMPQVQKIKLWIDEKGAQWVGEFNYGQSKSWFWSASKVNFAQKWKIAERPRDIDDMQDWGFIVDIDDPTNTMLHSYLKNVKIKEGSNPRKRIERDRDDMVDDMNADEYGLYFEKTKHALNKVATKKLGGHNEW